MDQDPSTHNPHRMASLPEMDFVAARYRMVECQIRPDRVRDPRILAAMASVARERFVPKEKSTCAYADQEIVLTGTVAGDRRVLLSPRVLARLAEVAAIEANHIVLDVGCGSGYSSAVLARSAQLVVSLEEEPTLAMEAEKQLYGEECDNVSVVVGVLGEGHEKQQPYHAIILQGSVSVLPENLLHQLTQRGRLACVRTSQNRIQGRGGYFVRDGDSFPWVDCFDAAATPLPGFTSPPPGFHFAT